VAPGQLEAIFEKFTRGHAESATPGVGLGQAICPSIVEAQSGRIWAQNLPTGGARFVFTLPLDAAPDVPMDDEPSTLAP
jgi:two-component system sensor histidine kinase KdpD